MISDPSETETLPKGATLSRPAWAAFKKMRAKVGTSGNNKFKWKLSNFAFCEYGEPTQAINHIMNCPLGPTSVNNDLNEANLQTHFGVLRWCDTL